jgi:hypothetical protein
MADREAKARCIAALKGLLGKDEAQAAGILGEIISQFPSDAIALISRAARGSRKREETLARLLLVRGDAGCSVSDQAIEKVLADVTQVARDPTIQWMADNPARIRFAPTLRRIVQDRADPHWSWAVMSLGRLKDRGAVDVLMEHTCGQGTPFVVINALVRLRCPEAALVFEPNVTHPSPDVRTWALWGLASLKYETPVGALVHLLDDPDVRTPIRFQPGQSFRAAQALADIHDWPFKWGDRETFDDVKRRSRELYPDRFVQACMSALAKGSLSL